MNQEFNCPHCGEWVPAGSKACPNCGADEETGWSDAAVLDQLNIPRPLSDEEYEESRGEMIDEAFGWAPERRPRRRLIAAAVAAMAMILLWFLHC